MVIGRLSLALLSFLLLAAVPAVAAPRGLLYLGDWYQSVYLDYNYYGNWSDTSAGSVDSSSHRFNEAYNVTTSYAVLDPRLLKGRAQLRFNFNQQNFSRGSESDSSSGSGLLYDIDGTLLRRKPYPVNFFLRSETTNVQRPFAPSYDLDTDSYGIGMSLKNRILPTRLDYTETTSETSGSGSDSRYETSNFSLNSDYSSTLVGNTSFSYSRTENRSESESGSGGYTSQSESSVYSISNRKAFGLNKRLDSMLRYLEQDSGPRETDSLSISESFDWQMGKALSLRLNYTGSYIERTEKPHETADEKQHVAGIILSHQLFQSLQTALRFGGQKLEMDQGAESSYYGIVDFDYQKRVAPSSLLSLSYNESLRVTDRDMDSAMRTIYDESMVPSLIEDENLLGNLDVLIDSLEVRNAATDEPYLLGTDFLVVQRGAETSLNFDIPGSLVAEKLYSNEPIRLLITYTYLINPDIRYETSMRNLHGSLSFDEGRSRVFGSFSQSSQEIISGQANTVRLSDSRAYSIGASRSLDRTFYSIVYVNSDSGESSYQYLEGVYRKGFFFMGGRGNLQARNRYTIHDGRSYQASDWENYFTLMADYSKRLTRHGTLKVLASYLNSRTSDYERDDVNLEGNYRWGYGKLGLEAGVKLGWRDVNGNSVLENELHMRLTRYFR